MFFLHKKYDKLIAETATAALVATAIVPAAEASSSFADVIKNYKDIVDYLNKWDCKKDKQHNDRNRSFH
ncbi:hypothetical protein AU377_04925 [Sporosarcina sp. HYO08]|nr:hypothetical protein AU377_04925 [Sporosarcina sp. HYO08]